MVLRLRPSVRVFSVLLLLTAFFLTYFLVFRDRYKPLHLIEDSEIPFFNDDFDPQSLTQSIRRQIAYLKRQDPTKPVVFNEKSFSNYWLLLSAEEFLVKLEKQPTKDELNIFLHRHYFIYQAGGRQGRKGRHMLVTGYYEPLFEGSLIPKAPYLTPIYSVPKSLVVLKKNENKSSRIGRYDENNQFVDFWSRAEIENQNLLKGSELVYLKDPFDAFLLHVQGSGMIRLPDETILSIQFAGSNGLEYNSIGKLLVDEKIMPLDKVSIPAIRNYLRDHPDQRQRVLHHNPRFIFFKWGDNLGPRGSSGEVLTPGRSIAIDHSALPGGTIGYLSSQSPVVDSEGNITDWKPLRRFVFPQDSGAAIKGTGRVDLFWGSGSYAEIAANHMKEDGKLYFLVKKGYPGDNQ